MADQSEPSPGIEAGVETVSPAVSGAPITRRPLATGAAFSTVAQVLPLVAGAALSVVVARLLGPSSNGRLSLVLSLVEVLSLLASLGLPAGITYLVSRGEWGLRRALRETMGAALVLGSAGAAVGVGVYALAHAHVLSGVGLDLTLVGLAGVPIGLGLLFAASLALSRDLYEVYAGIRIVQGLGTLVLAGALAAAFGLTAAVAGLTAAAALALAFGVVRLARAGAVAERARTGHDAPAPMRSAAAFGLRAWGADLLQLINYRLDIFVLSAYAALADVGVYSVALSVTALAWLLPSALQTVVLPRTADLDSHAASGPAAAHEAEATAIRGVRHGVVLTVGSALATALLLAIVPLVYGARFERTVWLGLILLPGVAALGVAKVASAITTGRGFPKYSLYAGLIDVPITAVLYLTLIPAFGATGAAIASSISYGVTTVLALVFFRRVTGLSLSTVLVPGREELAEYRLVAGRLRDFLRR
jgi:O-antigen/teichoic acid export membrane protein